jgi:hypothetical protein
MHDRQLGTKCPISREPNRTNCIPARFGDGASVISCTAACRSSRPSVCLSETHLDVDAVGFRLSVCRQRTLMSMPLASAWTSRARANAASRARSTWQSAYV